MGTAGPGKNSPALHEFEGLGYSLHFQDGPILEFGRNGTTNEEIIQLLIDRIKSLDALMHSPYNVQAVTHLMSALAALNERTKGRVERGIEGTSTPDPPQDGPKFGQTVYG